MYYHSITFIPHYRKISSQRFLWCKDTVFFTKQTKLWKKITNQTNG